MPCGLWENNNEHAGHLCGVCNGYPDVECKECIDRCNFVTRLYSKLPENEEAKKRLKERMEKLLYCKSLTEYDEIRLKNKETNNNE